jgi:DNA processing protein
VTARDRAALAALTVLAEPGDPVLGALLHARPPAEVLELITSGRDPDAARLAGGPPARAEQAGVALEAALARWRRRLPALARAGDLARHESTGIRMVCPGDPGWPVPLDDLGTARPCALWARGTADLAQACAGSVAIIGARAATSYGTGVAAYFAGALSAAGRTVVSGAARGIDAAAHRGALDAGGVTIAVLACGPDIAYPREHRSLLDTIAAQGGAVISPWPPGEQPFRSRFLFRNQIIVALAAGIVIPEAAPRSGTLAAARHATALGRPVMAVPGPITSAGYDASVWDLAQLT